MNDATQNDVTGLLHSVAASEPGAAQRLLPLVYDELRRLAHARLAALPRGQTLQSTALVHEAYLRLVGKHDLHIDSKRHFFFAAARAMRDILVERARAKAGPKRGGGRRRIELDDALLVQEAPSDDLLALDEALEELEREDPEKARIVELRFFAGMTMAEAATVLDVSERSLHRQWRFIKAWLQRRLGAAPDAPQG
jgi:RNA polymerase sigma factor (TIGR02999 family)